MRGAGRSPSEAGTFAAGRRWPPALAALAGLALAPACVTRFSSSPERPARHEWIEPLPDGSWPERRPAVAAAEDEPPREGEELRFVESLPRGRGFVREWRSGEGATLLEFSSLGDVPHRTLFELDLPRSAPRALVAFLHGRAGGGETPPEVEGFRARLVDAGFALLVAEVRPIGAEPARGLADADVHGAGGFDAVAGAVAGVVDERLAETAYAVEGVLELLVARRPAFEAAPLVLVGVEEGALHVPVVAARLGAGRHAGALLVAPGSEVLAVVRGGVAPERLPVVDSDGALTAEEEQWLVELTRGRSRLDPWHTARFLGLRPALVLLARFDEEMPTRQAERLVQRMQGPEVWRILGDHEDVIEALDDEADALVRWLEDVAAAAPAALAGAALKG